MSDRLKNFFKKGILVDSTVLLLLGLLSLTWFRGDNLIGGGDFGMPADWVKFFKLLFYTWDGTVSTGMNASRQVALLIPYVLAGALFQSLGFSLVFIEKFFFYCWFAGSGLSMYFLCSVLGMKRAGRVFASIFYMLNPFSLVIIWRVSHGLIQMPYAFAPLVFGLYVYGLKKKKGFSYIVLANFVWLFSTASAYANPRMTIVHFMPVAIYFLGTFIYQKNERAFLTKYTWQFLGFWFLLNFYWLFPFVATIKESVASAHSSVLMPDIEEMKLTSVNFFEAIRMLGYWSLKSGYKGEPYYPYWQFYDSFWVNLLSFLIPVLVVLGFINKEAKKQPLRFFFLAMIVFGLIGITGANPPVGKAIVWFYKIFPPLMLLARFNFLFFGLPTYLVFCILAGFGFLTIDELWLKKFNQKIIWPLLGFLTILLSVILVFPFWNGEVIKSPTKLFPGERYKIPQDWFAAKKWLGQQEDFFRLLPLPMSKTYNVAMKWGEGYSGGDLTRWFAKQPVLNVNTGQTFAVPMAIGNDIETGSKFHDVTNLLGFLEVKYLLLRNDTRWDFIKGHGWWFAQTPENIAKFLNQEKNLSLDKKFGDLEFYRVDSKILVPRIYVPQKMLIVDGEADSLPPLSQFLHPEEKEGFLLTDQNKQKLTFLGTGDGVSFIAKAPEEQKERQDVNRVSFNVEVQQAGNYRILFKDEGILAFYQPNQNWKVSLDQTTVLERSPESFGDNLISLGEISLDKGNHQLSFVLPPAINLVTNSSFEEPSDQCQYSLDAFDGKKSCDLVAEQKAKVVPIPFTTFVPGALYQVSLFAKNITGNQPSVFLWENLDESPAPSFQPQLTKFGYANLRTAFSIIDIPANDSWQNFVFNFKPDLFARKAGIALVSDSKGVITAENLFDKIEVKRVFDYPLILQKIDSLSESYQPMPEIEFQQINPVKYLVKVNNVQKPYFLVFSEAFHPGWKTSVEGEHFMANGFANGWYIKKLGNYQFTIYFEPQKLYDFSVGISATAFLLALGYLIYSKIQNQK